MTRLRISRAAQADLTSILKTSFEHWGEAGRARYAALLTAAMQRTAADPDGPTTNERTDLAPGVRNLHRRHARRGHGVAAPVHVLYYRVADASTLEIIRVLHERMDPNRHIDEPGRPAPKRRRR